MKYLDGEELTIDEIKRGHPQARPSPTPMVPVVTCGTSYRNKGVQKLLDAIVDYMPAPTDIEDIKGVEPRHRDEETSRPSDDNAPFAALAFKIATDPFVGKLCFFRVYSGMVEAGSTVYNSVKDNNERMGRILQMHANHRQDIDICYAGDIAAAVGLKNTTTGDTLCDPKSIRSSWRAWSSPSPLSVWPSSRRPRPARRRWASRWQSWLRRTPPSEPIPTKRPARPSSPAWASCTWRSSSTACCVSSRWRPTWARPQVAYRETIRRPADQDTKYARQSGGKGQYGHVKIKIEPNEARQGL